MNLTKTLKKPTITGKSAFESIEKTGKRTSKMSASPVSAPPKGRASVISAAAGVDLSGKVKSISKTTSQNLVRETVSVAKPMKNKSIVVKAYYNFGGGKAESSPDDLKILGGKGAGLAEMSRAGIPVPPGFVISTEVCSAFYESGMQVPPKIDKELESHVAKIEKLTGTKFGDPSKPLLLSVRSGSAVSMPGMMDTILNLGLNQETLEGFIKKTGDAKFAYDNYRRLMQMFGDVVLSIDRELFERIVTKIKEDRRIKSDSSLQAKDLQDIINKYRSLIKRKSGEPFPDDPFVQLRMARDAVFRSWNNPRAISYRRMTNVPSHLGTAVTVQAMVFGNSGRKSGTGVGFTRDPSTGENIFYGEYLVNAQGEDVVAGIRTPLPISKLEQDMPDMYKKLRDITRKLEKRYRDVQDFEFTIDNGKLYMLQTRRGKRTVQAAVKIAVDMTHEKLITRDEALMRIKPTDLDQLLHPRIDTSAKYEVIAKGLAASPGAASGMVCFTSEEAVKLAAAKKSVILVRKETNPDDIEGMEASAGILTSRGGMTSHAAVVARGMGSCCVAGAESLRVNEKKKMFQVGKLTIKEGEIITLNGSTGEIILGKAPTIEPELSAEFNEFMSWADEVRFLGVRANADVPRDAKKAIEFGAEGIGLCRTEHMFFAEDRLEAVQEMIIAETAEEREVALEKILPFQKSDFKALLDVMHDKPVTIRTLDPPLHEFLPERESIQEKFDALTKKEDDYEELFSKYRRLLRRIDELVEQNPMLGHRGCRLGIVYPEITEMQVRAIMEAACELTKAKKNVFPEIMIPLVGNVTEFENQLEVCHRVARETMERYKVKDLDYKVGTMIEIPRAALTADKIGAKADFFSFGTNDLTQMTLGFSRDDAGKFLGYYLEHGILSEDPFVTIDQEGVGQLIEMGATRGRAANPKLKVGICGEHGGDPKSIEFCHNLNLDYVSCSPYRVPIARLAAAQISLKTGKRRPKSARIKTKPATSSSVTKLKKGSSAKTATKKVAAKTMSSKKTTTQEAETTKSSARKITLKKK